MKRWISRILLEPLVCLIGEFLRLRWQRPVTGPEIGGRVVSQSRVVLPAAWSRRAFSASASSLPFWTSRSSWRSHAAQSCSRNQARNSASSSGESAWTSCSIFSTLRMSRFQQFSIGSMPPIDTVCPAGERAVSAAARRAGSCMRELDGRICTARLIVRTCTLLAEWFRHYDEPGVSVPVLANGAPPVGLIESHGAQAGV